MKIIEEVYYWFNTLGYWWKSPERWDRFKCFIKFGSSEVFLRDIYRSLDKYDVVWDLGAYNGDSTEYLAKFVLNNKSTSRVIAFEPSDNFHKIIESKRKEIYQLLVYDGTDVKFGGNGLTASISNEGLSVPTIKLSDFLDSFCFLKMDVEGAEYVIIKDLIDNDKLKYVNEFVIEFHVNDYETKFADCVAKLNKYYKLHYRTDACPLARNKLRQDILVHGVKR